MNVKKQTAVGTIILAAVAGILPRILYPDLTAETTNILSFSLLAAIMYIGCAFIFLSGLRSFTAELKRAYGIFCGGIIFFALSELQIPVLTLIGGAAQEWLSNGGLLLMLLTGIGCMYAGIKLFAGLFRVRSIWQRALYTTFVALFVGVGGFFVPTGPPMRTALESHGSVAILCVCLVFFSASAILLYRVQQNATPVYRQAMRWFFWALLSFVASSVITIAAFLTIGDAHAFITNGYSLLIQSLMALTLLKAAYEFNAISIHATSITKQANIIDIIIAAAARVSNVQAVDPYLDSLRVVTARLGSDKEIREKDEAILTRTYQELEDYLTQVEPVRRYTKQELRQNLCHELNLSGVAFVNQVSGPQNDPRAIDS
jgi:hypothetical protein